MVTEIKKHRTYSWSKFTYSFTASLSQAHFLDYDWEI